MKIVRKINFTKSDYFNEHESKDCSSGFTVLSVYNKLIAYYLKYATLFVKSFLGASCNKSHGTSCNTNKFRILN